MSGKGRASRFDGWLANGWNRRKAAVAARSGEGLFTIFADLHQCKSAEFTAYALASRLRASWMEAMVTKVARVSARFSKSLARRRLRPNQDVRSTTQRRGKTTKPFMCTRGARKRRELMSGNRPETGGIVIARSPGEARLPSFMTMV